MWAARICAVLAVLALVAGCTGGATASPSATPVASIPSPTPTSGTAWKVYTNAAYNFSLEYPPGFEVQSTTNPDGMLPPGHLLDMRAVDAMYRASYPRGEVDFSVYSRDAPSLDAWAREHTGPCSSLAGSAYYWNATANLITRTVGDHTVLEFDTTSACGATQPVHQFVLFIGSDHVFGLHAWYSDPDYRSTIERYAGEMLASVKG